jgi:hypothetical protein
MPCHAMPCHAMPCRAMPCHAMPCHAMPCHAMLCYAMRARHRCCAKVFAETAVTTGRRVLEDRRQYGLSDSIAAAAAICWRKKRTRAQSLRVGSRARMHW